MSGAPGGLAGTVAGMFAPQGPGGGDAPSWKCLPAWLAVALALRLSVALGGDFVLHPDEIMQHLEPAHRLVFGSGLVYWEFEYGARSWIIPGLVAGALWSLDLLGLGEPRVYVYAVKALFCILSLLVPWGAYRFARVALGEQAARIALVALCLWPYLVVFAHKPMSEFVSTSLLFGALGIASSRRGGAPIAAIAFGCVLVLSAAVRMHYLPVAALAWLACAAIRNRQWAALSLAGAAAALLTVGLLETLTWGSPFHSYHAIYVYNREVDLEREAQGLFFYLPRLLFATAGAALVALYAFARRPRRHLFALLAAFSVLALHMAQPHKEFRFVFVLIPLALLVAADQAARLMPSVAGTRAATLFASAFLAVIAPNLIDDGWLHEAASRERGNVRYLFGQENLFDAYLAISRLEDVSGFVDLNNPYHNSPGYYYLHHSVPFYDSVSLQIAMDQAGSDRPEEFVSHLVSEGRFPDLPGYVEIPGPGAPYRHGFIEGVDETRSWRSHEVMLLTNTAVGIARDRLGFEGAVKPPLFEFAQ